MEFSLLKTLEEFITPQELLIVKLDRNGRPYYQLSLRHERYEIATDGFDLDEEVSGAIDVARHASQSFCRQLAPERILNAWHLMHLKSVDVMLVCITSLPLSKLDAYMVNGLLGVYRNFFTVLNEAQHDQLTGLANRKTFDDLINKIHLQRPCSTDPVAIERRLESTDASYWLGMADLDNFKRINDTWGHLYGDEVLLLTAQIMQSHFREHDQLFRFGGEEFVIILRAPDQEHAQQAFERFRLAIQQHAFPQVGQVTISIGVTQMDPHLFSATLLDHADKALYFAKDHGRNQVCFYQSLINDGMLTEAEIVTGDIELF